MSRNIWLLQRWRTVVLRRYSDFLALQDVLLLRYPYRAIPRLPPKKYIATEGRGTHWLSLYWRTPGWSVAIL